MVTETRRITNRRNQAVIRKKRKQLGLCQRCGQPLPKKPTGEATS